MIQCKKQRLFIVGVPAFCGGARSEALHQLKIFGDLGFEIHIIPDKMPIVKNEMSCLLGCAIQCKLGTTIEVHKFMDCSMIQKEDFVISFGSASFIEGIDELRAKTPNLFYAPCMVNLTIDEVGRLLATNKIRKMIFQNEKVMKLASLQYKQFTDVEFCLIRPFFNSDFFPQFPIERPLVFGRISRAAMNKFSLETFEVFQEMSNLGIKSMWLGVNKRILDRFGINRNNDLEHVAFFRENEIPPQEFFKTCSVIIQSGDVTENLPRVCFEAWATNTVVIADKRGGWCDLIEDGKNGFLCEGRADFLQTVFEVSSVEVRQEICHNGRLSLAPWQDSVFCAGLWADVFNFN